MLLLEFPSQQHLLVAGWGFRRPQPLKHQTQRSEGLVCYVPFGDIVISFTTSRTLVLYG